MVSRLSPFWTEIIDDLTKDDLSVYAGQYVHSPDDQPIIGPVESVPGLFLNCAYWPGVMLSAAAGRWTADLIVGKMKNTDNPSPPHPLRGGNPDGSRIVLPGPALITEHHFFGPASRNDYTLTPSRGGMMKKLSIQFTAAVFSILLIFGATQGLAQEKVLKVGVMAPFTGPVGTDRR